MKLRFAKYLGLVLLIIAGLTEADTALAASVPLITYEYSQGKIPAGSSFYLQSGTATYQEWTDSMRVRVNFPVSKKEMDSLQANLRWYSFAGIETSKITAYGRGGDQVSWTANNKTITKSNAGQSTIKGSFSKWRYEKVVTGLKSFTKKKVANYYRVYNFELEAITDYGVRVAVDDTEVKLHSNKGSTSLLPGTHTIVVALYDNNEDQIAANTFEFTTPDTRIARIQVRNKDISVTTE